MMSALLPLLSVMMLSGPEDSYAAPLVETVAPTRVTTPAEDSDTQARITCRRSDFDREEGVGMFEGNVQVEYGADYVMSADRMFVFFKGTNRLSRIVALGNVAITNETRVGACSMAEFRRVTREIEMYGDESGADARLFDTNDGNELRGRRIRFRLDSEQVEVENAAIKVDSQEGKDRL